MNILVRLWQEKGDSKFVLAISDFGGAYLKECDSIKYGKFYKVWFQKQSLKSTINGEYGEKDICEDFLFALLRTVQYCLYICFIEKQDIGNIVEMDSEYFKEENIDDFATDLKNLYGIQINELWEYCVYENCFKFREIETFYDMFRDVGGN